jgi:ATP synthase protein I
VAIRTDRVAGHGRHRPVEPDRGAGDLEAGRFAWGFVGGRRIRLIHYRRMGADAAGPKKPLSETVRQLGALSTVGFSFVLAVGLGVWLGLVVDRWLGTSPWGFFLFFVFGLVAGVLNVYRTAGKFLK